MRPPISAALLAAALSSACAGAPRARPAAPPPGGSAELAALLDRYWQDTLALNPVLATAIGDDRYDDQLPNFLAPEYRARQRAHADKYLRALRTIDRARLAGQDRLSHDVLAHDVAELQEGLRFPDWMIPVHQFGSGPTFFAMLGSGRSIQPFRTVKDYEAFLGRMDRAPPILDQAISNMR